MIRTLSVTSHLWKAMAAWNKPVEDYISSIYLDFSPFFGVSLLFTPRGFKSHLNPHLILVFHLSTVLPSREPENF